MESLESRDAAIREDALYFLTGAGWLTAQEVEDVLAFHRQNGCGTRAARALWESLDMRYAAGSDFSHPAYLEYSVRKSMALWGNRPENFSPA